MKLIERTSIADPDDKAYRRHWPTNTALTHMLIILSWLVASVQMVSFRVRVESFHHAGSTLPLCDNRDCFCHGGCKPGYHFIPFVDVFWPNLAQTQSGAVFADINVVCERNSVKITWKIAPELVPYAARFFLGNCMASTLNDLTTGEGELYFSYSFDECKFKRLVIPG